MKSPGICQGLIVCGMFGEHDADFFMGSGSTIKEAIKLGRFALGVELEEERYNQTWGEIFPEKSNTS